MNTTTIQTKSGQRAVRYYTTGVPGLVVHRASGYAKVCWSITHRASGLLVTARPFGTREQAIGGARRLEGLADWTLDREGMTALVRGDVALGAQVSAALWGPPAVVRESVVEGILPDVSPLRTAGLI